MAKERRRALEKIVTNDDEDKRILDVVDESANGVDDSAIPGVANHVKIDGNTIANDATNTKVIARATNNATYDDKAITNTDIMPRVTNNALKGDGIKTEKRNHDFPSARIREVGGVGIGALEATEAKNKLMDLENKLSKTEEKIREKDLLLSQVRCSVERTILSTDYHGI